MKKILSSLFITSLLLGGTIQVVEAKKVDTKESEASISFLGGKLALDEVNNLEFGTYTIGSENTYSSNNPHTVTVKDFRGLADGGWSLNASISNFKVGTGNETLTGFGLEFTDGTATADASNNLTGQPSVKTPSLNYVESEDGSANFLSATEGNGRGSWTASWEDVELSIPEGSETLGKHTATITWELLDAPQ